jgi:hypothetical protein
MPLRLGHGMMRNHRGLARVAAGFLPNLIASSASQTCSPPRRTPQRHRGAQPHGEQTRSISAPASIASPANLKPRGFSANG